MMRMRIGEYQELKVVRDSPHGLYLGDEEAEVLLPRIFCPKGIRFGDTLEVFVLTDSEDRPVATTQRPKATVGEFAYLEVLSLTESGAFFDWGLDKDLFCPRRELPQYIQPDEKHLVRIYLDEVSGRVACTTKFNKYLRSDGRELVPGQPVKILVTSLSRDVVKVIVEDRIKGSIFPDEWHDRLYVGETRTGYVKTVRPDDGKVAISLRPQGYQAVLGEKERLMSSLRSAGGMLPVSDKSTPEEIHRRFGLSKSAFKKLIGTLYREGQIEIHADCIRLQRR